MTLNERCQPQSEQLDGTWRHGRNLSEIQTVAATAGGRSTGIANADAGEGLPEFLRLLQGEAPEVVELIGGLPGHESRPDEAAKVVQAMLFRLLQEEAPEALASLLDRMSDEALVELIDGLPEDG